MSIPPPLPPRPLGELVALLREADPAFRVFGSEVHRHRPATTLSEAEIAAFEAAHGIRLPDDYRAYLHDVGNGGAGPYYGIMPLAVFDGPPGTPFPYSETMPFEGDALPEDGLPGVVELAHHGCGMASCLVVCGPAYGTVWTYAYGVHPQVPSFDAWFRDWAEAKLRLLAREPVAARLRPGMTLAEAEAATGTPWRVRWDEPPLTDAHGLPYRLAFTEDIWATVKVDDAGMILAVEPALFL